MCLGTAGFELPEDFADIHPDLLPVVRSRFYLESVALQSRARGGEGVAVPQQPIGDHLSLSLVYDLPQAMRSIIQDDLDKWGISFYEAVEAARSNLEQMGNIAFASLQSQSGEGVYISATSDNYDASRLVMLDLVSLAVFGPIPGISSSFLVSEAMSAMRVGSASTASAARLYERMRKGSSPRISIKSAVS